MGWNGNHTAEAWKKDRRNVTQSTARKAISYSYWLFSFALLSKRVGLFAIKTQKLVMSSKVEERRAIQF